MIIDINANTNTDINININHSFARPKAAKAVFPNFKAVRGTNPRSLKLFLENPRAWGTGSILGELGTGAGGTGPRMRGNRWPGEGYTISLPDCKNP